MKITLDTTYILPLFGIEINIPNFKEEFKELLSSDYGIFINFVSIIEAKWKILKEMKYQAEKSEELKQRFKEGLLSITKSGRFEMVLYDIDIDDIATKFYLECFNDFLIVLLLQQA
ncbi:MAG: hypothetical protein ACE5KE_13955 [Methanosarcinales archaeon]